MGDWGNFDQIGNAYSILIRSVRMETGFRKAIAKIPAHKICDQKVPHGRDPPLTKPKPCSRDKSYYKQALTVIAQPGLKMAGRKGGSERGNGSRWFAGAVEMTDRTAAKRSAPHCERKPLVTLRVDDAGRKLALAPLLVAARHDQS